MSIVLKPYELFIKDRVSEEFRANATFVRNVGGGGSSYIVSPLDHGAAGDGTTDDTSALNETFNRSNAVIEGCNLSYKITEITMTECENLVISNFKFYHGISITLKHCKNIIFYNCVWDEFQDNGIANKNVQCVILTTMHTGSEEWVEANNWRMDEVCENITFDRCQFLGTHFTESTPSLYVNTKPHYNTGMCMRLEGVNGLRVAGCYFTQNRGNACVQQNAYAPLGDFEFIDNFFYLNCWGGIELYRYTGMSTYPTRIIQGNRFIGHGLGYLPWEYLELFPEKERGVGTAVLLGGQKIQNEPVYCSVCNNHFEDNNESSVEGWQWNPVKNNTIIGNGVLNSEESVTEMTAKYKIPYTLYVRKNPSQNPIYVGQSRDLRRLPAGEARVIENNTIARGLGTRNPILINGYFYEQLIIRGNTMTEEDLYENENEKFVHFLKCNFKQGLIWENNIGMRPYFNDCRFAGGEYLLDDLMDIYKCTFTSQAFDSVSKIDRLQQIRSACFNPEYASLRNNSVSLLEDGKPSLGYEKHAIEVVIPDPDWDIKNESAYGSNGYVFGGSTNPTVLDTGMALGATDQNWTIFIDTSTTGDNGAGNNTYLIKLLTFSDSQGGNLSLELGSRYTNQAWTWIFPNGAWSYDTTYQIDGSTSQQYLAINTRSRFVLRHKAGGKIEVFAVRHTATASSLSDILKGSYNFTSGTTGTLHLGGIVNSDKPLSYYNGTMKEAQVFLEALSDAAVSTLMLGTDISDHDFPEPVYDISDDSRYVSGTGLTFDGTFGIDTGVPILEDTNDFTIIAKFKYENMTADGAKLNFTFYPVFSAFPSEMGGETFNDKGFDVGLTLQNGPDRTAMARGGFISCRRDWRYKNEIRIDHYNYNTYFNKTYVVVIRRENGVITVYDNNLVALGTLTGVWATTIINGNLTLGAKMGYDSGYTAFFKGVISEFLVYDKAVDLSTIEEMYPSINDNEASNKGAVTYHLYNKANKRKSVRYALVEINYDLGEFNDDEYALQYPRAFAINMDKIYDDIMWIPCNSAKRVVFTKLCKWDAVYDPFKPWNLEIINPGTVPGLNVKVEGVKVLLLSKQEAVPNDSANATDFNITWESSLEEMVQGDVVHGYLEYLPRDATAGLAITATSEDTSVATVSVTDQDVVVTAVGQFGETVIHVSIPYGVSYAYPVTVVAQFEEEEEIIMDDPFVSG